MHAEVWAGGRQAVQLGSDLGPITSEYRRKPGYKTQSRPKRTNHIALVSLPWAQGVRGSNPRAPTSIPLQHQSISGIASFLNPQLGSDLAPKRSPAKGAGHSF